MHPCPPPPSSSCSPHPPLCVAPPPPLRSPPSRPPSSRKIPNRWVNTRSERLGQGTGVQRLFHVRKRSHDRPPLGTAQTPGDGQATASGHALQWVMPQTRSRAQGRCTVQESPLERLQGAHWRRRRPQKSGQYTERPPWGKNRKGTQGCIRTADPHERSPPPPLTKGTVVGKNEVYRRENLIRPFVVHRLLGPRTPPPLL